MVKQSCYNLYGTSSPVVLNYSPLWICFCAVTEFVCLVRANLACDQVSFLSVTFKWTNLILLLLLLLSFHPAFSCSSLLVLYKGQHQLPIYRNTLPRWIALPQPGGIVKSWRHLTKAPSNGQKKKREKREKANTAASKQQQDCRVTPCICWSGFIHPLLKLRRSFMVVPKNLKTDWSFVRCVKKQFRTKIPAFPAKCKVTFFHSTTRWNCQSLKSVLAWLLHRYLALGRNMKLPLSLHLHLLW